MAPGVSPASAWKARLARTAGRKAGSRTGVTRGATRGRPWLEVMTLPVDITAGRMEGRSGGPVALTGTGAHSTVYRVFLSRPPSHGQHRYVHPPAHSVVRPTRRPGRADRALRRLGDAGGVLGHHRRAHGRAHARGPVRRQPHGPDRDRR